MFIILTILTELVIISILILFLYRLKPWAGLAPLYVLIGSNQLFQTLLSTRLELEIFGGLSLYISPTIIFSAGLFAILLIYIKEGVQTTQRFIFSIILANLSLTLLSTISNWQEIALTGKIATIFYSNFRILTASVVSLILDAFIMIILYEFLFTKIRFLNLFSRLVLTLVLILLFDSLLFVTISFWETPGYESKLISHLFSKSIAAIFFGSVLWFYLRYLDKEKVISEADEIKGKEDIFSILTYKGRFEKLQTEKVISEKQLQSIISEKIEEQNKAIRRFTLLSSIRELRMDKYSIAEQVNEFLSKVKAAFETDVCTIHLLEKENLVLLSGIGLESHEEKELLDPTTPFFKEIIQKKKCLSIEDTDKDLGIVKGRETGYVKFIYKSCLAAPLLSANKVIGIIKFYSRTGKRIFTAIEIEHLQMVASQIAHIIENTQLFDENEKHKEVLLKQILAKKKAEEQIKISNEELRQLTGHLQTIREEEQSRIGQEIHDQLGQHLTVLKMDVSRLKKNIPAGKNKEEDLVEIVNELDNCLQMVRKISSDLRPSIIDDLGLIAALEWKAEDFEKRTEIITKFYSNITELKIPPTHSIGLFRIFQESLTNVARHAEAKEVVAELNKGNGFIIMTITDNGKGFDKNSVGGKRSLGLLGMRERTLLMNGNYEISSVPGKGTEIKVTVPL